MNFQWSCLRIGLSCLVCLAMSPALAQEPESVESEEQSSSFWRWWEADDAEEPAEEGAEEDRPWMFTSPFANVTWPEITMPKIDFRPPWADEEGEGGWISTPLYRVRTATRGAIDRTRTAWNTAVDRMKFALPGGDGEEPPQVATTERSPGFWRRMFGEEESAPEPGSVGDLMAKESDSTPDRLQR